jgi:hypothetical protein
MRHTVNIRQREARSDTTVPMNTLPQFLLRLIDSNRHGGRTIRTDESTVVLYDCGQWSDAHSQALHSRYPECEVEIMPSEGSLSGFIVVVKSHQDLSTYSWVTATFVVLAMMLMTIRHIARDGP